MYLFSVYCFRFVVGVCIWFVVVWFTGLFYFDLHVVVFLWFWVDCFCCICRYYVLDFWFVAVFLVLWVLVAVFT